MFYELSFMRFKSKGFNLLGMFCIFLNDDENISSSISRELQKQQADVVFAI